MVASMVEDLLRLQKILCEIEKISLKIGEDENDVELLNEFNDFVNEISYGILSLIISQ